MIKPLLPALLVASVPTLPRPLVELVRHVVPSFYCGGCGHCLCPFLHYLAEEVAFLRAPGAMEVATAETQQLPGLELEQSEWLWKEKGLNGMPMVLFLDSYTHTNYFSGELSRKDSKRRSQ